MARFYYHLHECGTVCEDPEGVEQTADQVRATALEAARDVMCGEMRRGKLCLSCSIIVENDTKQEVVRVPFREAVAITGL